MKHEYTFEELAELKSIYDESGEAGLDITEMRALRKAGLLTQGLPEKPAEPSKRDLILAHCKNRIDQGQPFDGKETAEALGLSPKTVGNILGQLRKEGLLPAFNQHSPRKTTRKNSTTGKKKETMTTTSKPAANKEEPMSQELTANAVTAPEKEREHTRAAITDALVYIYDAISALQKTAFQTNDKVRLRIRHKTPQRRTHGPESQLQQGHGEMRLKFNGKDGVFAIKGESEEEKTALKTSAPAICNLIIDFFNGEVQEMKVAKE